MNILELAEFYSNYSGNFIPTLDNFELMVAKKNHNVFYIFSNKNKSDLFYNWFNDFKEKHRVELLDFNSRSFVTDVVKYIKDNNIKLVHGHFLSSLLLSKIKKKCSKDVRFYQHIHNSFFIKKDFYAFAKRIRNLLFLDKNIDKICCSESILPSAQYTFPKSHFYTCKNAIDFSRLSKKENNYHDTFSILLLGHNYYIKGVDIAIEAIKSLYSNFDIHLDIVMGDRLEKNTSLIKSKYGEIPKCVSIIKPTQNVIGLYQSHTAFLNASIEEGMSYANIEAYYCGSLFISSDIPQNKEPNLPGVIYFKSGDVESLKCALIKAYKTRNEYKNDCEYVEKEFSLNRWSKEMIDILKLN